MVRSQAAQAGALAQLAQGLRDDRIRVPDADRLEVATQRLFDTLAAFLVGKRVGGAESWPRRFGADAPAQIRRMCALTRCSEIDDIDPLALVTPGAIVAPVALMLAEAIGADGKALLAALLAGYQAMVALGEGLDGSGLLARGVWPTYLLAPAAAAAAAASLWDLDEAATLDALAIALARTAGVAGRPPREPTSRWWLCGCAAADGVLAADAAAAGLGGDPALLERGLGVDAAIAFDVGRLRPHDPIRAALVETKPLCTARQALPAIEAALALRSSIRGRSIEAVEVAVPEAYRAMVDRPAPADRTGTLQSAQFQVAAALSGDPVLEDPVRARPALGQAAAQLQARIVVVADPQLSAGYPALWSARVVVRLADGERLTESCAEAPGARARLDWEGLAAKYTRAGLEDAQVGPLLELCRSLPSAGAEGVAELLSMTAEEPTAGGR